MKYLRDEFILANEETARLTAQKQQAEYELDNLQKEFVDFKRKNMFEKKTQKEVIQL